MRQASFKTHVLLLIVIAANAAGNVLLGFGMRQTGAIASYSPAELIASAAAAAANPWVASGVACLLVFFIAHTIVLSRADLSYVLLVTSIGYVLVALLSWACLGETISAARWTGTVLITVGVALAGSTPVSTTRPAPAPGPAGVRASGGGS